MAVYDRRQVLTMRQRAKQALALLALFPCAVVLSGCGLLLDAFQLVLPIQTDELAAICARQTLQVGMGIEPRQPFVFPAIWTDVGSRVTGLDVELVKEMAASLTAHCGGRPVTPVLHLVHFRDLFVQLNEGKVDLFVSAVNENAPAPNRAGLAYSVPYFYDGGLVMIIRQPDLDARVRAQVPPGTGRLVEPAVMRRALAGLTVAVQEGTTAELYATANLKDTRLLLCESLPAAFESQDPPADVILSKQPLLAHLINRVRKDWKFISTEAGQPHLLSSENYAVIMAEESYSLRQFINDLLFRLEASGRLEAMRRRWMTEDYVYPRRASAEGLPFAVEKMVAQHYQGECRVHPGPGR